MERVTITIDDKLLAEIDRKVDGHGVKNRSHAIDLLLKKALAGSGLKKALVLAGGKKEILLVPGQKAIKPLAEIGGKPVLEHILSCLKSNGIGEAVMCVGYAGESIVAKFKSGEDLGMKIDYVWEESPVGSAGALRLAKSHLNETFLLTYADVLYDALSIEDMLRFHRSTNALCTLALTNVKDPRAFGVAKLTGSRIVAFTEKPAASQSNLVNAGVAICEPEIIDMIRKDYTSFERDLLPAIAEKERLYGYIYSGAWFDVGRPDSLEAAKKHFASKKQ
ncbi:MAG: sugar phosphate nucleotidyltransferase [Candidatus Micrarchaeota archaeon]|nr:sugar phosphate nucleotidyltransferase [Candidatus Micrarchaeota archaeon]